MTKPRHAMTKPHGWLDFLLLAAVALIGVGAILFILLAVAPSLPDVPHQSLPTSLVLPHGQTPIHHATSHAKGSTHPGGSRGTHTTPNGSQRSSQSHHGGVPSSPSSSPRPGGRPTHHPPSSPSTTPMIRVTLPVGPVLTLPIPLPTIPTIHL